MSQLLWLRGEGARALGSSRRSLLILESGVDLMEPPLLLVLELELASTSRLLLERWSFAIPISITISFPIPISMANAIALGIVGIGFDVAFAAGTCGAAGSRGRGASADARGLSAIHCERGATVESVSMLGLASGVSFLSCNVSWNVGASPETSRSCVV